MSERNPEPNYPLRRVAVAGALAVTVLGGVIGTAKAIEANESRAEHAKLVDNLQRPDALQEYLKGDNIPRDKAVRLVVPGDMPANTFAKEIKKANDDQWELTQQIKPQVDAQGDPGAQLGEHVVVEAERVDPRAIEEFGVPDLQDGSRQ